jgi:hypothetical protein
MSTETRHTTKVSRSANISKDINEKGKMVWVTWIYNGWWLQTNSVENFIPVIEKNSFVIIKRFVLVCATSIVCSIVKRRKILTIDLFCRLIHPLLGDVCSERKRKKMYWWSWSKQRRQAGFTYIFICLGLCLSCSLVCLIWKNMWA